jgi:hypothetical protein
MAAIRRVLLSLLLLSLVPLSTEPVAALGAAAITTQASETRLIDMLPTEAGVSTSLELIEEGERNANEIAAGFPDPGEASSLLLGWGFQENAYRIFAGRPGRRTANGTVRVEVSLHAFATAPGATQALPYYATGRATILGLEEVPLDPTIADQSMAVGGMVENGIDATVYFRVGAVLARVSALSLDGDPLPDALTGANATLVAATALPSSLSLADLLPTEADVPAGLVITQDVERTLAEVAVNYSDPAETERRFINWGWKGNAARGFDGSGQAHGITRVHVSLHRFGSADSTMQALDYSVADQAATTGATRTSVSSFGDRVRALVLRSAGGNEVTIYAQQGTVLIRVTVVSTDDDAKSTALEIAHGVARKAETSARPRNQSAQTLPATEPARGDGRCAGAVAWWTQTSDRLAEISLRPQLSEPLSAGLAAEYAATFATLRDAQERSNPPPAAADLNQELVTIFDSLAKAFEAYAAVKSGNVNPMAAPGALAASEGGFDRAGSALLTIHQVVNDFTAACGL